jgi:hypothetical protein
VTDDAGNASPETSSDDRPPLDEMTQVRRRRSPKYPVFVGLGAFVGVLVAVGLTYSLPATREFGYRSVVGYMALTLGLVGGLVGGAVALVLDRRR